MFIYHPKVYIRKILSISMLLISPVISLFESIFLRRKTTSNFQPVFIIGAPRTGSTILYQAITSACDVSYIDNLACRWHRNLLFGFWLSHKIYKNKKHTNFKAEYGNTHKFGQHAPSECGGFWYRWLPKTHHFIDNDQITSKVVNQIHNEIASVINYFGKPLIFKNLNAGQRLRLIHKVFPQAKFIYIKRDPRFVIRSILKARKENKIKPNQWWSIMPPNFKQLLSLPEKEMIASQVYYIEKQIETDLQLFPPENIKTIHYQSFSKALITDLSDWINIKIVEPKNIPVFRKDNLKNIPIDEIGKLTKISNKHPFPKEQYI